MRTIDIDLYTIKDLQQFPEIYKSVIEKERQSLYTEYSWHEHCKDQIENLFSHYGLEFEFITFFPKKLAVQITGCYFPQQKLEEESEMAEIMNAIHKIYMKAHSHEKPEGKNYKPLFFVRTEDKFKFKLKGKYSFGLEHSDKKKLSEAFMAIESYVLNAFIKEMDKVFSEEEIIKAYDSAGIEFLNTGDIVTFKESGCEQ
jgi:hypothetical protein